jgi:hypothetical protein
MEQRSGWGRQNNGGRDQRAGPATAPNLIDTGNGTQTQLG